jgi:CRP-like cAMP-binding protein
MASPENLLLASLPRNARRELLPHLRQVDLAFGAVLQEPGQRVRDVYFPLEGLVSLLAVVDQKLPVEVGMVGREGMVGVQLALGASRSPMRALVHGAGTAMRMGRPAFTSALEQSPALRKALLGYVDSLMAQMARTAACNRFHVVEARLARWLLMTRDRTGSGDVAITQQFLSSVLGVQRVGVSAAASAFQRRRLIAYSRGHIRILDHAGLEAASCTCYAEEPATVPRWRPAT